MIVEDVIPLFDSSVAELLGVRHHSLHCLTGDKLLAVAETLGSIGKSLRQSCAPDIDLNKTRRVGTQIVQLLRIGLEVKELLCAACWMPEELALAVRNEVVTTLEEERALSVVSG